MLLLIIAIATFQMLSQGPERRGWGAAAGNSDVFLSSPLIHLIYLKRERRETVSYDASVALLLAPAPASSVALSLASSSVAETPLPSCGCFSEELKPPPFLLFLQCFGALASF